MAAKIRDKVDQAEAAGRTMEVLLTAGINDPNSEVNQLNEVGITTIFNAYATGLRAWGNRSAAWPTNTGPKQFVCIRRVADIIAESVEQSSLQFVDRPINNAFIDAVTESVNAFLRTLIARGAIIDGKCWYDKSLNEATELAAGHIVFSYDFMYDLRAIAAEHTALPLSLGTGQYLGRYTIVEIREQTLVTDQYGGTISQTAELRLREWVGTDVQETGEAVVAEDDPVPGAILWDETADVDAALEVDTGEEVSRTTLLLARAAELGELGLSVLADVVDAAYGLAGAVGLGVAGLAALAQTAAGVVSDVATIAAVVADTLVALPEIPVVEAAMATHQSIVDAAVLTPYPGLVAVYPLTESGTLSDELAATVLEALSADKRRPITDQVIVRAPIPVDYTVTASLVLYAWADAATVRAAAATALASQAATLQASLGAAIVPSKFVALLQNITGVQSVNLTAPAARTLAANEFAVCTGTTVTLSGVVDG